MRVLNTPYGQLVTSEEIEDFINRQAKDPDLRALSGIKLGPLQLVELNEEPAVGELTDTEAHGSAKAIIRPPMLRIFIDPNVKSYPLWFAYDTGNEPFFIVVYYPLINPAFGPGEAYKHSPKYLGNMFNGILRQETSAQERTWANIQRARIIQTVKAQIIRELKKLLK